MLWPESVRSVVKTGPDREVVAVYPYRSACPTSTWAQLIAGTRRDLFFAGFTNYFLWLQQSAFHATLREKAASGCRVRFLLGNPDSEVARQREELEDVALAVSTRIRSPWKSWRDSMMCRVSNRASAIPWTPLTTSPCRYSASTATHSSPLTWRVQSGTILR
ncbi:hypothetical protein ACFOVU_22605 [Nocardiopsis sediminis]|uniref:Uncharacterized protein n=1 Tax=Nocardiopsis sediminis TaxID=1778267 RepID=A0ABV8FTJ4_9ACTN